MGGWQTSSHLFFIMKFNMYDFIDEYRDVKIDHSGCPVEFLNFQYDYDKIHTYILRPIADSMKKDDKLELIVSDRISGFRLNHIRKGIRINKFTFDFSKLSDKLEDISMSEIETDAESPGWFAVELAYSFLGYKRLDNYLSRSIAEALELYVDQWEDLMQLPFATTP